LTNFNWFDQKIKDLKDGIESLCKGLDKLIVVDVSLQRGEDNPQLIFESMNSTGRELSQADLIRNFVLMGLEPEEQSKLYRNYWRQMELKFGQDAYTSYFDSFMRHYLTIKSGEMPNVDKVYEAFKRYANSEISKGYENLVSDISAFATFYCAMALGEETEPTLKEAFQDLRELRVDVAYALLLEMYSDYKSGSLSLEDFESAVRLVEAYVFRRAVCSIPTNSMNKTFAHFAKDLDKSRYLTSVKASLQMLPSYRRFPSDEEFVRDLKSRDLYNFARRSYWLRRIENFGKKERVAVDNCTIEHIMPQNDELNPLWQRDLGVEWKAVQTEKLHTLGNLTLTAYNSEYSDRSFLEKRDLKDKGLKSSPLVLNEGLGDIEVWNLQEIELRAARLGEKALSVWAAPGLPADVVESFRKPKTPSSRDAAYDISHFPQLSGDGKLRQLFERLEVEITALDPCVTVGFLKLYVAFKAETNFVDVIPQANGLRLSLNMPFPDLVDPEGRARDITGKGRWGNGDCSFVVNQVEDIPYAIGLIRQSLERQLVEAS
jgi:predicted transport protein